MSGSNSKVMCASRPMNNAEFRGIRLAYIKSRSANLNTDQKNSIISLEEQRGIRYHLKMVWVNGELSADAYQTRARGQIFSCSLPPWSRPPRWAYKTTFKSYLLDMDTVQWHIHKGLGRQSKHWNI